MWERGLAFQFSIEHLTQHQATEHSTFGISLTLPFVSLGLLTSSKPQLLCRLIPLSKSLMKKRKSHKQHTSLIFKHIYFSAATLKHLFLFSPLREEKLLIGKQKWKYAKKLLICETLKILYKLPGQDKYTWKSKFCQVKTSRRFEETKVTFSKETWKRSIRSIELLLYII